MGAQQEKWFTRLREIADKAVREPKTDVDQYENVDISRLITDIQTYQVELEFQNEELRSAQAQLSRSRDRFMALFNKAPVGHVVLDAAGFVLEANHKILQMIGRNRDAVIRQPFSEFIFPEDRRIFLARYHAICNNPENKILEIRLTGLNDLELYVRIEGQSITFHDHSSDTACGQVILNVTDISESKKAEFKLRKSEEDHRNFLNALSDAVVCADLNGNIVFLNSCAENFFGCRAEDALGTSISRFCPSDLMDEQRRLSEQALRHHRVNPFETERLKSDGSCVPVEISLSINLDKNGGPVGFNAVIRDISERKKAENKIKNLEAFQSALLEAIPIPVFYKDIEGRYLGCNKAFLNFFGKSKNEIIGKTVFEINPPELAERYHHMDSQLFETETIQQYESRVKSAERGVRDVVFFKDVFRDAHSRVIGLVGGILDTTDLMESERKKAQIISDLVKAMAKVKKLSGLLPICSYCKKIRDDAGYWRQIEEYLFEHSEAQFSHSICRECAKKHYPDFDLYEE